LSARAAAGELTGNGKETAGPANANSICVFSGQNDDLDAPLVVGDFELAPNGPGGIAQSHGQDVKIEGSGLTQVLTLATGAGVVATPITPRTSRTR
jgi:hypothetical protein